MGSVDILRATVIWVNTSAVCGSRALLDQSYGTFPPTPRARRTSRRRNVAADLHQTCWAGCPRSHSQTPERWSRVKLDILHPFSCGFPGHWYHCRMADALSSSWLLETIVSFLRSPSYKVSSLSTLAVILQTSFCFACHVPFCAQAHFSAGPDDGIH